MSVISLIRDNLMCVIWSLVLVNSCLVFLCSSRFDLGLHILNPFFSHFSNPTSLVSSCGWSFNCSWNRKFCSSRALSMLGSGFDVLSILKKDAMPTSPDWWLEQDTTQLEQEPKVSNPDGYISGYFNVYTCKCSSCKQPAPRTYIDMQKFRHPWSTFLLLWTAKQS